MRMRRESPTTGWDEAVEEAVDLVAELEAARPAMTVTISAAEDWDELSLDGQRALLKAVIERIDVLPGEQGRTSPERLVIVERT